MPSGSLRVSATACPRPSQTLGLDLKLCAAATAPEDRLPCDALPLRCLALEVDTTEASCRPPSSSLELSSSAPLLPASASSSTRPLHSSGELSSMPDDRAKSASRCSEPLKNCVTNACCRGTLNTVLQVESTAD